MLEKFYQENRRIVYGYLLSICADPHLADDLTSETFLKAAERIHTYNPAYKPSTWLCTIGRNLYLNECKRKKAAKLTEDMAYVMPSPEELLIQHEQAQQVIRIAESMQSEQRLVLFMRLQGMRFRDVGLALGKTENWARVTYYRAKAKIVAEMEDE